MDWGSSALGPRFTEIDGDRHWRRKAHIWNDTDVGFVLHYLNEHGRYVPFMWKTHRDVPRPPRKP